MVLLVLTHWGLGDLEDPEYLVVLSLLVGPVDPMGPADLVVLVVLVHLLDPRYRSALVLLAGPWGMLEVVDKKGSDNNGVQVRGIMN